MNTTAFDDLIHSADPKGAVTRCHAGCCEEKKFLPVHGNSAYIPILLALMAYSSGFGFAAELRESIDPLTGPQYAILYADDVSGQEHGKWRNHPLLPALRYAYERYQYLNRDVRDYVCNVFIRERIKGRLRRVEAAAAKVRHRRQSAGGMITPFGVYMRYLGPRSIKGREILYVDKKYHDRMIVTLGGESGLASVTLALNPTGRRAMSETRYSISSFGMLDTVRHLIQRGMTEMMTDPHPDEWEVRFIEQAKMDQRSCRCIQVVRTKRREEYSFYRLRIFVDHELQVPVRFTFWSFPSTVGGRPRLDEEYSYTKVRLNVGLDDSDFDLSNPDYGFDEGRVEPLGG